jgi:hypothetical protein
MRFNFRFEKFPYLTFLSNIFLGFALGKIIISPGDELPKNILIKVLLIIGACLFWNYLLCVRKAGRGITRNIHGRMRPLFREALLCAYLNASIFIISMSLFFFKLLYL